MKKKRLSVRWLHEIAGNRFFLAMKLIFFLMFFVVLSASASIDVMSQKVNLDFKDADLSTVFKSLEVQTGHIFVYSADRVQAEQIRVSVQLKDAELAQALEVLLKDLPYQYSVEGLSVLIIPAPRHTNREILQIPQKTINGRITDETGSPLVGATVIVKGTTRGVATDVNGRYSIGLPAAATTLEISFIGYKKVEVQIGNRTEINLKLEPDAQVMEDVVVTGYQTISKERATGAYSIVSAKELEQKPTANIASALNGLVPGLAVQSSPVEGTPRFLIRGQGTLQADQADCDPLIVVDGFPISGYSEDSDPFATINPNDVESITVLKDAAATSIYGARAANGVIVITTKKGKTGNKLDISADAYWSVSSRADLDYLFNMATAENQFRYVELMHKYNPINLTGTRNPYITPSARVRYMSAPYSLLFERDGTGHITAAQYDAEKQRLIGLGNRQVWKDDLHDYIFRQATRSRYNVALRGTTERMNYSFSASYDKEKGYLEGNDNQRVLLNLTSSTKLTKNLTFDVSLNTVFTKKEKNGKSVSDLKKFISPWTRLVDDNGAYTHVPTSSTVYEPILLSEYEGKTPASWLYNPVEDRRYTDNTANTMNYRLQGGFSYATTWGLNLSAKGQYEWQRYKNHISYDAESFYVRNLYNTYSTLNAGTDKYISYFPGGGVFSDAGNIYEGYNLRGQADYTFTADKHILTLLAGSEILSASTEMTPEVTRYGFNKYTNSVISTPDYVTYNKNIFGVNTRVPYEPLGRLESVEDRFFSVYANASYTFDERYSLTVSFRTDASNFQSKTQRDKFSPFYSLGGSWLISREKFMSKASWVDLLKLRVSYGIAGVAAGKKGTSSVTTLAVYPGSLTYTANEAYNAVSARGNSTLTWEKSRTWNLGLDAALFGHKLSGSIEFYNKYSYDVLSDATVPVISQGVSSATFNNAEVLNRGVELSIGSNLRIAGDLKWKGTLNYAYNHNEVKKYNMLDYYMVYYPGYIEGYSVDVKLAYKAAGYSPEGFIILQGKDGTQEIVVDEATSHGSDAISRQKGETLADNNWIYYLGTSTPKSNLSFSSQFTWKGLTLSFMLTGRFSYYVSRGDAIGINSSDASFSKQLDKSFEVYDQGYQNQTSYTAFPLLNDDNYLVYRPIYLYDVRNINMSFASNYIKGDHIRLNEIYLGYDLPERWLSRQNVFRRVNVYAQASNLGLIWSANKDMDPDYTVGNIKPMPTFTFGLKLSFKNW